ncbi:MAG: IS200/IS605 family element transposase accessory protein TnpB [Blastochloris sp.]|nr:IS200/IS605 family element transposase accessory protein TnpB [Blastochloris sp.]
MHVDDTADAALQYTQQAFNQAATYCASVAWDQCVTNKNTLHKLVYGPTRVTYGLGAQLACCARDKAAEAVRRARHDPDATCPVFRDDGSIRDDARTYRLKSLDRVSLNTLSGRVVGQLVLGDFQRRTLYDTSWQIGGAELIRRAHVWYLHITQTKADPEPDEPTGVIGVDLGIVNLATDSDGETYSGQQVTQVRERRFKHRQRLQQANTRRARWRLRQLAGTEARFQRDVNHQISTRLVQKAKQQRKALALEDLTGIRKRVTVRRSQRRQHASWAFFQLRQFVSYKAQRDGVWVYLRDARNTSRTCHVCGYCDKRNRKPRDLFVCGQCGHTQPADENAAINISRVDVNPPMVLRHCGEGASTSHLL